MLSYSIYFTPKYQPRTEVVRGTDKSAMEKMYEKYIAGDIPLSVYTDTGMMEEDGEEVPYIEIIQLYEVETAEDGRIVREVMVRRRTYGVGFYDE